MPSVLSFGASGFVHGFGLLVCVIGVLVVLVGLMVGYISRRAQMRGVAAAGTIVGYSDGTSRWWRSNRRAGLDLSHPVVEFTTAAGQFIRATAINSSTPLATQAGSPITVYYDAGNPERFWAETQKSANATRRFQVALVVVGVLVFIAGLSIVHA